VHSATTGRRNIVRKIIVAVALSAVALSGCGSPEPQVRACATVVEPPVAAAEAECDANRPGVRWYSAPASVIDEDDAPVVGEQLDGDWYDWKDQMDLDEHKSKIKPKSTAKKPTKAAKATKR
jgi:hypothetical protein